MAKIVKMQEVEIGLEEVIRLIKKNWNLLAGYISYDYLPEKKIIAVRAPFFLVGINENLRRAESLIIDENELKGAIADIFREIEHQNPHFKNMMIGDSAPPRKSLDISFDVDVAGVPVMPVDPLDIESDDQARVNPNRNKRAKTNFPPHLSVGIHPK